MRSMCLQRSGVIIDASKASGPKQHMSSSAGASSHWEQLVSAMGPKIIGFESEMFHTHLIPQRGDDKKHFLSSATGTKEDLNAGR